MDVIIQFIESSKSEQPYEIDKDGIFERHKKCQQLSFEQQSIWRTVTVVNSHETKIASLLISPWDIW